MTEKELLTKFQWLQCTSSREDCISAFWRRFGKQPQTIIQGQIGNIACFYVGPVLTTREEHHDKEYKAV